MLAAKYLSVKMQFCKGVASENGFQWNVVASYMLKKSEIGECSRCKNL